MLVATATLIKYLASNIVDLQCNRLVLYYFVLYVLQIQITNPLIGIIKYNLIRLLK